MRGSVSTVVVTSLWPVPLSNQRSTGKLSAWSAAEVGMILGEEIRIFEVKGQHKIANQKSSDRSWTLTLDQKFWFPSGMSIGDVTPHFECVRRSMGITVIEVVVLVIFPVAQSFWFRKLEEIFRPGTVVHPAWQLKKRVTIPLVSFWARKAKKKKERKKERNQASELPVAVFIHSQVRVSMTMPRPIESFFLRLLVSSCSGKVEWRCESHSWPVKQQFVLSANRAVTFRHFRRAACGFTAIHLGFRQKRWMFATGHVRICPVWNRCELFRDNH